MIRSALLLAIVTAGILPALAQDPATAQAATDVSARSRALELAGAFSNDGYKIRDGFWPGEVEPGRPKILEVNLFSGNEYWFTAAVTTPGQKIAVTVYDEQGKPVEFQAFENGPAAAAGFVPETSGRYFVKLDLTEGEKADFCLLYSYK